MSQGAGLLRSARNDGLYFSQRQATGHASSSRLYGRLQILGRRDEFFHFRRSAVLAHVFKPDAVDARVLILVFDLVAAVLDALRHRRQVVAAGAKERDAVRQGGRIAQAADRGGEITRRLRAGVEMLVELPVG